MSDGFQTLTTQQKSFGETKSGREQQPPFSEFVFTKTFENC